MLECPSPKVRLGVKRLDSRKSVTDAGIKKIEARRSDDTSFFPSYPRHQLIADERIFKNVKIRSRRRRLDLGILRDFFEVQHVPRA